MATIGMSASKRRKLPSIAFGRYKWSMRGRRWLVGLAALPVAYVLGLVVLGFALRGCVTQRVADRLSNALDAEVTIGDSSLSLLRGKLELQDVAVHRDDGGSVDIEIDRIDVDLASLGWVVFDRDVDYALVDGMRIEVSARGLYDLAERRKRIVPIPIGELDLKHSSVVVMPTSLLPKLGRITVALDRVHTTDVSLRHGLSWLFRMQELTASVEALGFQFGVDYSGEQLGISGGMFGSDPVSIRFPLPVPDPNGSEIKTILRFAKELSKAIGSELKDTVKDAVLDWVSDLF